MKQQMSPGMSITSHRKFWQISFNLPNFGGNFVSHVPFQANLSSKLMDAIHNLHEGHTQYTKLKELLKVYYMYVASINNILNIA